MAPALGKENEKARTGVSEKEGRNENQHPASLLYHAFGYCQQLPVKRILDMAKQLRAGLVHDGFCLGNGKIKFFGQDFEPNTINQAAL